MDYVQNCNIYKKKHKVSYFSIAAVNLSVGKSMTFFMKILFDHNL